VLRDSGMIPSYLGVLHRFSTRQQYEHLEGKDEHESSVWWDQLNADGGRRPGAGELAKDVGWPRATILVLSLGASHHPRWRSPAPRRLTGGWCGEVAYHHVRMGSCLARLLGTHSVEQAGPQGWIIVGDVGRCLLRELVRGGQTKHDEQWGP
jgi:hypothetical protein